MGALHGTWDQLEGEALTWADAETDGVIWADLGIVQAGSMAGRSAPLVYDIGDVATFGVTVSDSTGTPDDATVVTCVLTQPDGTTVNVTPVHVTTGVYEAGLTVALPGRHVVTWAAYGANASTYTDAFNVLDTATAPILGLSEAKAHLNITTSAHDEELRIFLAAATAACERHTGRVWGRRIVTENLPGGHAMLMTSRIPVISVVSVEEDDAAVTGWTADTPSGVIVRDSGTWGAVAVTYVAGGATIPGDIAQGVKEMLRHLWETQRGTKRVLPGDDWDPGQGYSVPRRVAELWDGATMTGLA